MQNKPNFRKSQMNLSAFSKMAYENKSNWTLGENKPKQTQFHLPPGEPALLALRSFSEGGSVAEGGLPTTFFGAFLQRVFARPEKTLTP
jgi:hypothetical protein